jgi:hypothetical protein
MTDFYLISTEIDPPYLYAPRTCHVLRWLRNAVRDDLAFVTVDPPIPREIYDTEDELRELMLGSRFQGESLLTLGDSPVYVYICRLKRKESSIPDDVGGDFDILDWGAVFRTAEAAAGRLRTRLGSHPAV